MQVAEKEISTRFNKKKTFHWIFFFLDRAEWFSTAIPA